MSRLVGALLASNTCPLYPLLLLMRPVLIIICAKCPRLWELGSTAASCQARFLFLGGVPQGLSHTSAPTLRSLCCSSERRESHDCQDEPPQNQLHWTQSAPLGSRAPLLQPFGWQPGVQGDEEDGEFLVMGCFWVWG